MDARLARPIQTKAVLQIGVREGIQAETIHKSLDRLFELSGCPRCGLNGFDLDIRVIDDDWSRQFGKMLELQREVPQMEGIEQIAVFGG